MQNASKQSGFGTEHGLSMRQRDHHPERNDNDEAQGIEDIITDIAPSALEDKETIKSTFTTMAVTIKYLQKIEAMENKYTSRKINNNNKSYCWTHGRTRNNNHTSSTCIKKNIGYQDDVTFSTRKGGLYKYYTDS